MKNLFTKPRTEITPKPRKGKRLYKIFKCQNCKNLSTIEMKAKHTVLGICPHCGFVGTFERIWNYKYNTPYKTIKVFYLRANKFAEITDEGRKHYYIPNRFYIRYVTRTKSRTDILKEMIKEGLIPR